MSQRRKVACFLLLLAAALALLAWIVFGHGLLYRLLFELRTSLAEMGGVREALASYHDLAPGVFMGLQVLQVMFAPLPGEATGILGGYLFGVWPGFLYSTLGLTVGASIAFGFGRFFGTLVIRRLQGSRTYRRFNRLVVKGDFVIPFVLFLIPGFPKDILSYLMGLSVMPFRVFVFITGVARMPGTLMLSLQGAQVYQGEYLRFLLLTALSLLIALPCFFSRKRLLAWLARVNDGRGAG